MKYGTGSAIMTLLNNGNYTIGETTRFKASFDVYPTTTSSKTYSIVLREKCVNPSGTTKSDNIIQLDIDGNVHFRGLSTKIPYKANKWIHFDVFYEFTGEASTSKYAIYMNGSLIGEVTGTNALTHLVESIGINWADKAADTTEYTIGMDNLCIATVATQ